MLADTTPLSVTAFESVFSAITGQITVSSVVGVIAALLGLTVAFAFMWWGVRYGIKKLMAAIKKGDVRG